MTKKMSIIAAIIVVVAIIIGSWGYYYITSQEKPVKEKLSPVLNVYNWEDYFGETTISDFENETGVKVNLYTYEDEDIMYSAIESNPSKYDLVVMSDSLVPPMVKAKLLAKLDMKNIPNFKNIANEFKNPSYDPGNDHTVPYLWGTTGIAVNTNFVSVDVDSWCILWNSTYAGKISMLNSVYEVLGATLKYLGYSINTENLSQLEEAKQLLLEQKPLLRGYDDCVDIMDDLISEDLWVAQEYSGEALFASWENEDVTYVLPKEGASIWVDNLGIPIGSPHKYTAEVFINFILRANVSAEIANYIWYANCNEAAREFTDPEILENPNIYPSQEVLDCCEYWSPEPKPEIENKLNEVWADLMA